MQPIRKDYISMKVTDEEEWYCSIEEERQERLQTEQDKIANRDNAETCENEDSEITVGQYIQLFHRETMTVYPVQKNSYSIYYT